MCLERLQRHGENMTKYPKGRGGSSASPNNPSRDPRFDNGSGGEENGKARISKSFSFQGLRVSYNFIGR